ncbi:MAG: hypothetical protein RBR67_15175 [Desulfobacterium sp.]|jgi:cell filamentation protein|nr:hypothetical protein [Desulfobacterium sp.]
MNTQDIDRLSKQKAYDLYDSGVIHTLEIGTTKGLQDIHRYLFNNFRTPDMSQI